MKINLKENNLAIWIICESIGKEYDLINKFNNSNGLEHDIVLTVDGVELNFLNFINSINKNYNEVVKKAARKMYTEQIDSRSDEIANELDEILIRLKYIRDTKFPEIDW